MNIFKNFPLKHPFWSPLFDYIYRSSRCAKEKKETGLIDKINLGQTSPSHMSGSYTSQFYRNAQVNQDI